MPARNETTRKSSCAAWPSRAPALHGSAAATGGATRARWRQSSPTRKSLLEPSEDVVSTSQSRTPAASAREQQVGVRADEQRRARRHGVQVRQQLHLALAGNVGGAHVHIRPLAAPAHRDAAQPRRRVVLERAAQPQHEAGARRHLQRVEAAAPLLLAAAAARRLARRRVARRLQRLLHAPLALLDQLRRRARAVEREQQRRPRREEAHDEIQLLEDRADDVLLLLAPAARGVHHAVQVDEHVVVRLGLGASVELLHHVRAKARDPGVEALDAHFQIALLCS